MRKSKKNKMKQMTKTILITAGVISGVTGIFGSIPTLAEEKYTAAAIFFLLIVIGIILFAIGFGE